MSASTPAASTAKAHPGATAPLFQPIVLGPWSLPHRMVMAPLTRSRARQPGNVPTPLNAAYYAQRASAALIISEATQVSMQGQGYAWTPGIHSREQIDGWRLVTAAVHAAGGLIFLQMWHVGRISHPALQPDHMLPVAPSAIRPAGEAFIENDMGEGEMVPFVTPRALQTEEMPYLVAQYVRAARNAREAGFDGAEVHGANGYLLDQFICSGTNQRSDEYGGSVANRARLLMEVTTAVSEVWGRERVGVRLSPLGTFNDVNDDDPQATFTHIVQQLDAFGPAYLHVINPAASALEKGVAPSPAAKDMLDMIRATFRGKLILAGGFHFDSANEWLAQGKADLIAFGRDFLANPDLPERFRQGAARNTADPSTFYGGGAKGYTDYPTLAQTRGEAPKPCVDETWR